MNIGNRIPYLVFAYSGYYTNIYGNGDSWGYEVYDEAELMFVGLGIPVRECGIGELVAMIIGKIDELLYGKYKA